MFLHRNTMFAFSVFFHHASTLPACPPKRHPLPANRAQSRCSLCEQVLFHNFYSPAFLLVPCPKQGTVLRPQNLSAPHSGGRRCQDGPQRSEEYLDSTSRPTAVICRVRLAGISFHDLDGLQLQHPRAVLQLVARVDGSIVWRLVADHRGDDFEPAHSQAAQRAGVTLAFLAMRS